MRKLLLLPLLLLSTIPALARGRLYGFCEQGAQTIAVVGYTSSTATPVQRSYPLCTITVYLPGTLTLAAIYSDNSGTALANPFTADANGYWFFYANNGRYDVNFSGAGITPAFTHGDIDDFDGTFNLDPGVFDSSSSNIADFIALSATEGHNVNPDVIRGYITNEVGHRPEAIDGSMIIPSTATVYEADAVAGQVLSSSVFTNAVAGSFFASLNGSPWIGTCSTSGTNVTLDSGPPFNTQWATALNTLFVINGADYSIATVPTAGTLTLTGSAGTQSGVPCAKRIYLWGVNVLVSDGLPGAPGAPSYDYGYLTNEWDYNVFNQHTKVIAHSIGGASSVQPDTAVGYLVNGLGGAGIKWNCGFCTLDGSSTMALIVGTATTGNNTGSQPIQFYSRDAGANVSSAVFFADPGGNIILRSAFTGPVGTNPATLIEDGAGTIILGIQGGVGATPLVQGSGRTRFQPGTTTFSDLGTEGGGAEVFCSDCTINPVAPNICIGGGTGAVAFRSVGLWKCPF